MTLSALAIIPARGGSKRIPRKNIKEFCGQPIIKYSIEAAIKSDVFDEVMVSTDDEEIAELAKSYGAKVPFMRTFATSNDQSMLTEVLREVILKYQELAQEFRFVCCIFATAPFIRADRLQEGYELLKSSGADSVLPVTKFGYPIQRASRIDKDGKLHMFAPENYNVRSQDLEPAYHDCGQFCWLRVDSLLEQMRAYANHTVPLVLPESEVQDVDTLEDWQLAEFKYQFMSQRRSISEAP